MGDTVIPVKALIQKKAARFTSIEHLPEYHDACRLFERTERQVAAITMAEHMPKRGLAAGHAGRGEPGLAGNGAKADR
jgi:hypothetical protein